METPWQQQIFSVSIRKKEKWHWARQQLTRIITPQSKCLDIGSGVGTLSVLQEKLGGIWEFTETDPAAAEETRKVVKGKVYTINIFDPKLTIRSYDCLTIFDVIEHVQDPKAFLQRASDLLKPGGYIVLTTPADNGSYYLWRRLAEKIFGITKEAHGHVVEGFSDKQLRNLGQACNLSIEQIEPFSFTWTEVVELAYNGAYILKNRKKQKTGGYNLALSPASGGDVARHGWQLQVLRLVYPILRGISLLDRVIPLGKGYEWGVVLRQVK